MKFLNNGRINKFALRRSGVLSITPTNWRNALAPHRNILFHPFRLSIKSNPNQFAAIKKFPRYLSFWSTTLIAWEYLNPQIVKPNWLFEFVSIIYIFVQFLFTFLLLFYFFPPLCLDTQNIRFVFAAVKDTILQMNLRDFNLV